MNSERLESQIKKAEESHLIAMPCPQDGTCEDGEDVLRDNVSWWLQQKDVMNRHLATTILNISNEWYSKGDDETLVDEPQNMKKYAEVWSRNYVEAVKRIRQAGIHNLIVVDVSGCGQGAPILNVKDDNGIKYAQRIIDADTEHNIAFSIHMYHVVGHTAERACQNIQYGLDLGVPVMLGEFAFEHKAHVAYPVGGPVAWQAVQNFTREHNVGWFVWSWNGNGGDAQTCDMFDSNGNLLDNGKCMIYGPQGMFKTSTPCTIYKNNPGTGLAYQYPEGPFHFKVFEKGGSSNSSDASIFDNEPDILATYPAGNANAVSGSTWKYYTTPANAFNNIKVGGKLMIKMQGAGKCSVFYPDEYQSGYPDQNKLPAGHHIIADSQEDGKYYWATISDGYTKVITIDDDNKQLLQNWGIRYEVENDGIKPSSLKYHYDESQTDDSSDIIPRGFDYNINKMGDYYIAPEFFKNLDPTLKVVITGNPA